MTDHALATSILAAHHWNARRVSLTHALETLRLRALAEGDGDRAAWCLTLHAAAWASSIGQLRAELPGWERAAAHAATHYRPLC